MKDIYDASLKIISENISKGNFFLKDLEKEILKSGSLMRVAPGVTVKDYLDELVYEGF